MFLLFYSMVRVQNRIRLGMELLQYFTMRQWNFKTEQTIDIIQNLKPEEQEIFFLPLKNVDVKELIKNAIIGSRVYCLKEPLENLPRARRHLKWLVVFCLYTFSLNLSTLINHLPPHILWIFRLGSSLL